MAQELSTMVLPSEDELAEALLSGEIDSAQYEILLEIIEHGIDSTTSYLLDEVPNLFYIPTSLGTFTPDLEIQQQQPFQFSLPWLTDKTVYFNQRYTRNLNESSKSGYLSTTRVLLSRYWRLSFQIRRDKTGRERFTERTISYVNNKGVIRELKLGSFKTRWGLGTIMGYHGKLFDYSERLDFESFLFPDYGAFNGFYGSVKIAGTEGRTLVAVSRDEKYNLISAGTMLSRNLTKNTTGGVILGINRMENRSGLAAFVDRKLALYVRHSYSTGYTSVEGSRQFGDGGGAMAIVGEGRHHISRMEFKYAAWQYADRYIDFTGGSKATNIRNTVTIDEIEFTMSNKRAGQKGVMVKTIVHPLERWELYNALLVARLNRDTGNTEYLAGLGTKVSSVLTLNGDYLARLRERSGTKNETDIAVHRFRMESKLSFNNLSVRIYIAYNIDKNKKDYYSFFSGFKYRKAGLETFEIWSNMERIEPDLIQYWYLYMKTTQNLFRNLALSVKVGNAYRRNAANKNLTTFSVELKAVL